MGANSEDEYFQSIIRRTRHAQHLIGFMHSPMRPGLGIPPPPKPSRAWPLADSPDVRHPEMFLLFFFTIAAPCCAASFTRNPILGCAGSKSAGKPRSRSSSEVIGPIEPTTT